MSGPGGFVAAQLPAPIATMRCRYPMKDKAMKMIAIALATILTMTALAQAAGPSRFFGVTSSYSKTFFGK